LIAGDYLPLDEATEAILAFLRRGDEQTCLVALNFSAQAQPLKLGLPLETAKILYRSNLAESNPTETKTWVMQPFEVIIAELAPER